MKLSDALQLIGMAIVIAAAWWIHYALGVLALGACLIVVGLALETPARKD